MKKLIIFTMVTTLLIGLSTNYIFANTDNRDNVNTEDSNGKEVLITNEPVRMISDIPVEGYPELNGTSITNRNELHFDADKNDGDTQYLIGYSSKVTVMPLWRDYISIGNNFKMSQINKGLTREEAESLWRNSRLILDFNLNIPLNVLTEVDKKFLETKDFEKRLIELNEDTFSEAFNAENVVFNNQTNELSVKFKINSLTNENDLAEGIAIAEFENLVNQYGGYPLSLIFSTPDKSLLLKQSHFQAGSAITSLGISINSTLKVETSVGNSYEYRYNGNSDELIINMIETYGEPVIVKYLDDNQNPITEEDRLIGRITESYDVAPKEVEGYVLCEGQESVFGVFTNEPQEIIFYYSKQKEKQFVNNVSIFFKDAKGHEISDAIILGGFIGDAFSYKAREIEGYTLNSNSIVEGFFTEQSQIITYSYSRITPEYSIVYTDGTKNEAVFKNQEYVAFEGSKTPIFHGLPVREGFVFKGWSPAISENVNGDSIYTALWEKDKEFTVSSSLDSLQKEDNRGFQVKLIENESPKTAISSIYSSYIVIIIYALLMIKGIIFYIKMYKK